MGRDAEKGKRRIFWMIIQRNWMIWSVNINLCWRIKKGRKKKKLEMELEKLSAELAEKDARRLQLVAEIQKQNEKEESEDTNTSNKPGPQEEEDQKEEPQIVVLQARHLTFILHALLFLLNRVLVDQCSMMCQVNNGNLPEVPRPSIPEAPRPSIPEGRDQNADPMEQDEEDKQNLPGPGPATLEMRNLNLQPDVPIEED
ncbi:hypothetical protein L5515_016448 [Caenorhabditis briggsae]|uniref:Uncharacterized protein n=1 Tax=Caenorhabditis briggsae TaxID=6238 RepID=A0AAE9FB72_CAEBR|nr:hypothetical protein L5515_016448 [Caenorhabditis briggsae]